MVAVLFPLAAVILALVAVLFVYAWYQFWYFIGKVIAPSLPGWLDWATGVIQWVSGAAASAADAVYQEVLGWAESAVEPLVTLINGYVAYMEALWGALRDFAYGTSSAIKYLTTYWVPNYVGHQLGNVSGEITAGVQSAEQYARDQANYVANELNGAYTTVENQLSALEGQVSQSVSNALQQSEQYARDQANYVANELNGAYTTIEGEIQAAEAALEGEMNALRGETATGLQGLEQQIGQTGASILQELNSRAIPLEQAIAVAIPAEIAAVTLTFDDWIKNCGDPLCNTLGPLTQLIPLLENLFSLGLFMAWVTFAVTDPEGAASDTITVAGPIANSVGDAITALV